jgi:DNA-binding CsgD family transcriptional regulator
MTHQTVLGNSRDAKRTRPGHGRAGAHKPGGRSGSAATRLASTGRQQRTITIDAVEGAGSDGRPTARCDVRLLASPRAAGHDAAATDDKRDFTAVVILHDATPSDVLSCVRAATRGGASVSPELLERLVAASDAGRGLQLSEREYDVLRMLADGESTRGIAQHLSYSERTVKTIVRDLLVKMNCKTRAHAVALAARQGVI